MTLSLRRIRSVAQAARAFGVKRCGLVFLTVGLASSAFAGDVKVPKPIFDEAAAREFPQAVFDQIVGKITFQTTFLQVAPKGLVRWSTRTIKLVDFVKAPSQTYPDTYLFAMRYLVSVVSEKDTLAAYGTSCQAVVVYKDGSYDDPTVVCEPVNLDRPTGSS